MATAEPSRGHFTANVHGDVEFQMSGSAIFDRRPNQEDGRWIFLIVLTHDSNEGDGTHQVTFSNALPTPVRTGKYKLGDMGKRRFVAIYSTTTEGGAGGTYAADEGRLQISVATLDRVSGSFRFRASGVANFDLWAEEGVATVTGEFDAVIDPDAFERAFRKEDLAE